MPSESEEFKLMSLLSERHVCQLQFEPFCQSVSETQRRDAFIKSYDTVSMTL